MIEHLRFQSEEIMWFAEGHTDESWLPCEHPERPIDRNAARLHLLDRSPCEPCRIALEAHERQETP